MAQTTKNTRKYEVRTFRLTEDDLARAQQLVTEERVNSRVIEWRDKGCKGLVLRITPRSVQWYIRFRDTSVKLESWMPVEMARNVADMAKTARRTTEGGDPRRFVKNYLKSIAEGGSEEDSFDFSMHYERTNDPKAFELNWTWGELVEKFLDQKLPDLKEKYRKQYASYLRHSAFDLIKNKRMWELSIVDLERCRDAMKALAARSAVRRAVQQGKEMLDWAWQNHAADSGLHEVQYKWWDRWTMKYKPNKRVRSPSIEELARTLAIAENYQTLAGVEYEPSAGLLGALWAVILTAQRTGPLMRTRRNRLFDHDKLKSWKVANWTAMEMKGGRDGGRPHSLPIPAKALAILDSYRDEADEDSEWLFPSVKSGPITQSALNRLLGRLQGNDADQKVKLKADRPGKPGPKPRPRKPLADLFAKNGIDPWTPHDVRRSLTTFLDDVRLGGAASAILAHKITDEKVPERELMAPVTETHYNSSQKIMLKAEGMSLWVDAILTAHRSAKRELTKTLRAKKQEHIGGTQDTDRCSTAPSPALLRAFP